MSCCLFHGVQLLIRIHSYFKVPLEHFCKTLAQFSLFKFSTFPVVQHVPFLFAVITSSLVSFKNSTSLHLSVSLSWCWCWSSLGVGTYPLLWTFFIASELEFSLSRFGHWFGNLFPSVLLYSFCFTAYFCWFYLEGSPCCTLA